MKNTNANQWLARSQLYKTVRRFFDDRHYLEIDTPVTVICPGTEIHLRYFETQWFDVGGKSHPVSLRSSPELHMKQAVAAGHPHIYQIGPCFRNGGECTPWHHPEFTMLEWYASGQNLDALMDTTQLLLEHVYAEFSARGLLGSQKLDFHKITRISVADAFWHFAQIELIDGDQDLFKKAAHLQLPSLKASDDFETAYFKILLDVIEPELAKFGTCFLFDYPPSQAALAVVDNGWAKRFECYVGSVELCNGFFELTGEAENRIRFAESMIARQQAGLLPVPTDEDFFRSQALIHKSYSGNALGFDRLLALLSGASSLDIALPFRRRAPFSMAP
jgi:elongation factor P--(R)-beta-lysine ligase